MKRSLSAFLLAVILVLNTVLPAFAAEDALSEPVINGPVINGSGIVTWECINFGTYPQAADGTKAPVKWRVLKVEDSTALLLSDKNLDMLEYDTSIQASDWESSSLRSFLNSDFYNEAFTADERAAVKEVTISNPDSPVWFTEGGNDTSDKVFCLSIEDVFNKAYGFMDNGFSKGGVSGKNGAWYSVADGTRKAVNTAYAASKEGYYTEVQGNVASWWLRSPGYNRLSAAGVSSNGAVYAAKSYMIRRNMAVRPALYIDLSKSVWTKAESVSARGGIIAREFDTEDASVDTVTVTDLPSYVPAVKNITFFAEDGSTKLKASQNVELKGDEVKEFILKTKIMTEGDASFNMISDAPQILNIKDIRMQDGIQTVTLEIKAPGTAFFSVCTGNKTKSVKFNIKKHATGLEASVNSVVGRNADGSYGLDIRPGESLRLSVFTDILSTDTVKWSVDGAGKKYVSVNAKGIIKAKSKEEGTALVTASLKENPEVKAVFKVNVKAAAKNDTAPAESSEASLNLVYRGSEILQCGEKALLDVFTAPDFNNGQPVNFRLSGDKGVIAIDAQGRITAKKAGKAVIEIYSGKNDLIGKYELQVVSPLRHFKLNKTNVKIKTGKKGKDVKLSLKTVPAFKNGTTEVSWLTYVSDSISLKEGQKTEKAIYHAGTDAINSVLYADVTDKVTGNTYRTFCYIQTGKSGNGGTIDDVVPGKPGTVSTEEVLKVCMEDVEKEAVGLTEEGGVKPGTTGPVSAAIRGIINDASNGKGGHIAYIPSGTYYTDTMHNAIKMQSDVFLMIDPDAEIIYYSGDILNAPVFSVKGVSNAAVIGGTLKGKKVHKSGSIKYSSDSTLQEQHGFYINNDSKNIWIGDMVITDCLGDGIDLGESSDLKGSDTVNIDNCHIFNNGRTNIAVIAADNVDITRCTLEFMLPESESYPMRANINIEPNTVKKGGKVTAVNHLCKNIRIEDCYMKGLRHGTRDGHYFGFITGNIPYDRSIKTCDGLYITNCYIDGDSGNYSGKNTVITDSVIKYHFYDFQSTKKVRTTTGN